MGRIVRGAKCPWGEMSVGRNGRGAKCPWGEISVGRNVRGAKCPWGEMSWGELSWVKWSRNRVPRVVVCGIFPRSDNIQAQLKIGENDCHKRVKSRNRNCGNFLNPELEPR
jgi:hypothetical protein